VPDALSSQLKFVSSEEVKSVKIAKRSQSRLGQSRLIKANQGYSSLYKTKISLTGMSRAGGFTRFRILRRLQAGRIMRPSFSPHLPQNHRHV
jgi:hypothetical protein